MRALNDLSHMATTTARAGKYHTDRKAFLVFITFLSFALAVFMLPCVDAAPALWYSEDFISNASLYANGWIKANNSWNGAFNITDGYFLASAATPSAIYNPTLKDNMTLNGSYYILFNTFTLQYAASNFLEFGLSAPMNTTLNHLATIRVSESNSDPANMYILFDADGVYCSVNDSTRYNLGSALYNKSILYNLSINGSRWRMTNNYTATAYNWLVTCQNQSNMSFTMMSRISTSKADYIRVYYEQITPPDTWISAKITAPANLTHQNAPLSVYVNYTGAFPSAACQLYANGTPTGSTQVLTNNSVSAIITGALSDSDFLIYANCSNSSSFNVSAGYLYTIDSLFPVITLISPYTDNTSVFDKSMNISGGISDDNLYQANITIKDFFGAVMYNDYQAGLIPPSYDFSQAYINTTAWADGVYQIVIEASDSHTAAEFGQEAVILQSETADKIYLEGAQLDFTLDKSTDIKFNKEADRITFDLQSAELGLKTFSVDSSTPFKKVEGSAYPCHYVFNDYWIDTAELPGADCRLTNNDLTLVVTYVQDMPIMQVKSIGGLNIVSEAYSFNITHCAPAWTCYSFQACNLTSGLQKCLSVYDANTCGDPFTGSLNDYDMSCVTPGGTTSVGVNIDLIPLILVIVFLTLFICSFVFSLNILSFISGLGFAFMGFTYMTDSSLKIIFVALGGVMVVVWGLRSVDSGI